MDLNDPKWNDYSRELKESVYNTALSAFYYRVGRGQTYIGCEYEIRNIFPLIIKMYNSFHDNKSLLSQEEWGAECVRETAERIMCRQRDLDPREEDLEKILTNFLTNSKLRKPVYPNIPPPRFILTKPRSEFHLALTEQSKCRAIAVILLMLENVDEEGLQTDDIKELLLSMGYNTYDYNSAVNRLINNNIVIFDNEEQTVTLRL